MKAFHTINIVQSIVRRNDVAWRRGGRARRVEGTVRGRDGAQSAAPRALCPPPSY
jgi:hypothetical protein